MKKTIIALLIFTSVIASGQTKSLLPNKTLKDSVFAIGDIIKIPELIFDLSFPIRHETVDSLKPVIDFLKKHPTLIVEIGHHTDIRGSIEQNNLLSEFRMKHVWEYLVKERSIDPAKLKYKGYGETLPIIKENQIKAAKTREGKEYLYSLNRRTEFKVLEINISR